MKVDQIYEAWKESKKTSSVSKGFSEGVMEKVRGYEKAKAAPWFAIGEFLERMYTHRLVRAGLIGGAALAGLLRMALAFWTFLAV